jgi:type IV secretion system protein VirB6
VSLNAQICQRAMENVGGGVGASLRAVDCAAADMAQAAFGRLFGAEGMLTPALTILLTLFIAFIGFGLLTGRLRIGLSSLTPRMVTLALVVTFATSWLAFQSVFYNLAVGAPDEIARVLMGIEGRATDVFADKIDLVFGALLQASGGGAMAEGGSVFSPPGLMWLGGTILLLGTVGVLATCKIALAVLMALGPVFIVMALFDGTRGLFVGWLKGVVLLAVTPLFAVLGGSMMLELAVPVISSIGAVPGQVDPRAAMAFFMIGAVHAALMIMTVKVAASMVSGWTVFGLANPPRGDEGHSTAGAGRHAAPVMAGPAGHAGLRGTSPAPAREIRVVAGTSPAAANDSGFPGGGASRETRIIAGAAAAQPMHSGPKVSRTKGVGSRFRAAPASLLLAAAAPAMAGDPRIQSRLYDPEEVVTLRGKANVQATIRFGEEERIENVAIGDSSKWQVTPNKRADLLFVKPLAANARTNMTVVTNENTYLFDLVASPGHSNPLYVLSFDYPQKVEEVEVAEAEPAIAGPNSVEQAAANDDLAVLDPATFNWEWAMEGSEDLLPQRIFDNGRATFLAWSPDAPLPVILVRDHEGKEGPVNYAVRGDVLVVDLVPREFVLRSGEDTAILRNEGPVRAMRPAQSALAQAGAAGAEAK